MKHKKYLLLLFVPTFLVHCSNIIPKLENDTFIDALDKDLSENEKEKKMTVCFELTQKEFIEKRDVYQKMAVSIKDKESITSNDALRALFHQNLITCYFNSNIKDINSVINRNIPKEEIAKMFAVSENTPLRFSSNQLKILERVISMSTKNTGKQISGGIAKQLSGFYGHLYFIFALLLIGISFYFALDRLNKSIKGAKGKINKKNK
ncbi:putative signal peptide-containing protein [Cryptosporidium hominis]